MRKDKLLMTPGPTMVPPAVLAAEGEVMIHHRTSEYGELFAEINRNLQSVFQTKNPVLTYPAAGTGGLEAAVVNFFSPGDPVLVVSIGVFGDRFAAIAKAFGLEVTKLDVPWGQAVDPTAVEEAVKEGQYKGVFVTHNETSTGAVNDIEAIGKVLTGKDTLYVVDAVSSLGALDLQTDAWGVDVVITSSQKALMAPPGLAFMSVSERAWEAAKSAKCPKFYWDALKARKAMEKNPPQNPYTPAVSLLRGLNVALKMILAEGLPAVFARHHRLAEATREAVRALGLPLFAAERAQSDCITSIAMPEGLDGEKVKKLMSNRYGVIVAGGQEDLKGKVVRIGHMGYVNEQDVLQAIAAFEQALRDEGYPVELGSGVAAAMKYLG